jgi:hypothetical protein
MHAKCFLRDYQSYTGHIHACCVNKICKDDAIQGVLSLSMNRTCNNTEAA